MLPKKEPIYTVKILRRQDADVMWEHLDRSLPLRWRLRSRLSKLCYVCVPRIYLFVTTWISPCSLTSETTLDNWHTKTFNQNTLLWRNMNLLLHIQKSFKYFGAIRQTFEIDPVPIQKSKAALPDDKNFSTRSFTNKTDFCLSRTDWRLLDAPTGRSSLKWIPRLMFPEVQS